MRTFGWAIPVPNAFLVAYYTGSRPRKIAEIKSYCIDGIRAKPKSYGASGAAEVPEKTGKTVKFVRFGRSQPGAAGLVPFSS